MKQRMLMDLETELDSDPFMDSGMKLKWIKEWNPEEIIMKA
jgi:hypothetical protein